MTTGAGKPSRRASPCGIFFYFQIFGSGVSRATPRRVDLEMGSADSRADHRADHDHGREGQAAPRRCRKSRPERVRPAPARLGLPAKRLTFLAVVIAEAFGTLAGRGGLALRFPGKAAIASAVSVLDAGINAGLPRR